jgi:hypothetical protein
VLCRLFPPALVFNQSRSRSLSRLPSERTTLPVLQEPIREFYVVVCSWRLTLYTLDKPFAALAQVFDITSLYLGPFFNNIQQLVYDEIWNTAANQDRLDPTIASQIQIAYGVELTRLGELSYIDVGGGTQDPVLDFRQATNNPYYIFVGKIAANVSSSDNSTTDTDWQRWDATSGSDGLANSVYLIETLGGQLNSVDPGSVSIS